MLIANRDKFPLLIRCTRVRILLQLGTIRCGSVFHFNRFVAVYVNDTPVSIPQIVDFEMLCGRVQIAHELNRFTVRESTVANINDFVR